MSSRQVLFAMTGARSVSGGIAAVNLNLMLALIELARERRFEWAVYSLLERGEDRPEFLPENVPFRGFRGSKRAMAWALLQRAYARPIFLFERAGLAVPLLPLTPLRLADSVIFAHGRGNWRDMRRLDLWAIRTSRLIITNSNYTLNRMQKNVTGFTGVACPLGLASAFRMNERPPDSGGEPLALEACDGTRRALGSRVLLLVGRIEAHEREKGHYPLIDVLPAVLERFPETQLVFPGPGNDRDNLREHARARGVAASVFVPGKVSAEMLDRLYRHCYAFVMPSRQEGFGLVYLEAMNWAKACVGCFDDGGEDVIADGETGLLVRDPNDLQELQRVLSRLLEDPERTRALGLRGFERLRTHFTAEQFRGRFKECFARVL